ncbi:hypothetical protein LCGC14_1385570 [marine sediment metagenome]|uniref:Uncharacterized protein n=1 Tax=marine sediment metagenome TaxID=412755 RepID=A0A0F9N2Z8_9ZZZZ
MSELKVGTTVRIPAVVHCPRNFEGCAVVDVPIHTSIPGGMYRLMLDRDAEVQIDSEVSREALLRECHLGRAFFWSQSGADSLSYDEMIEWRALVQARETPGLEVGQVGTVKVEVVNVFNRQGKGLVRVKVPATQELSGLEFVIRAEDITTKDAA